MGIQLMLDLAGQLSNFRLGVLVVTQVQEVVPLGSCHHHGDVAEWLNDTVDQLLVDTELVQGECLIHSSVPSIEPSTNSSSLFLLVQLLLSLHAFLVLAPVHRHGRIIENSLNHFFDGDGTTGAGVTAEHTVSHELSMHEAWVT
ncbi:hypothetical protein D3C86_984930 [compost metagenome]